jgi:cobalamin biosynthesis protein CobT
MSALFLSTLLEEDENSADGGAKSSADLDLGTDKGDLKDQKDVKSDSDDSDEDNTNDDNDDVSDDDSSDLDNSDSSSPNDSSDDTEATDDDNDSEEDEEVLNQKELEEQRKKLNRYNQLKSLVITYRNLDNIYEKLLKIDLPGNLPNTIRMFKDKIAYNRESLDNLLLDPVVFNNNTVSELTAIHNVYMSDLRAVAANLKILYNSSVLNHTKDNRAILSIISRDAENRR